MAETGKKVVTIDGPAVRNLIEDESEFNKQVDYTFKALDLNGDGVLSRSELRRAFESMKLIETGFGVGSDTTPEQLTQLYDSIFERFDLDQNGKVDRKEFRQEMSNIMLTIADALGSSPLHIKSS